MRVLTMVVLCLFAAGLLSIAGGALAQPDDHRINLNLVDADLRDALSMLFQDTGKSFVLAADANAATRITMKLVGVDFQTALQAIMDQAGLRAQVAGDVYTISAARTAPPPPVRRDRDHDTPVRTDRSDVPRHDGDTFVTTTGTGSETITTTINVLYGDAAEIASLFGGTVAAQRFAGAFGPNQGYGSPGSWQGSQYRSDPYQRGYYPGSQQRGNPYRTDQPYSDPYRGYYQRGNAYRGYESGVAPYGARSTGLRSGLRY